MGLRRRALPIVLTLSLVVNAALGLMVWADAKLIEQLGTDMEMMTTTVRPLVMQQEQISRLADDLQDQLNECRLSQIKRLVGVHP